MKYMGSKNRIAKYILPIMLADRKDGQFWVEPFVGGANMIDKVDGNRIGADFNHHLIAMLNAVKDGWIGVEKIDKELYDRARVSFRQNNGSFSDKELGWIGFMASFNGRSFGGGYNGNYKPRDYTRESISNLLKQVSKIKDIDFICSKYEDLHIPNNSIIYCDSPYQGTKEYDVKEKFDFKRYHDWLREKARDGHTVFVSEYSMPDDFECIWSKEINVSISPNKTVKPIEKLFRLGRNDTENTVAEKGLHDK